MSTNTTHVADGRSFTGLGITVYRWLTISTGFKAEAAGFRLTARAPKMGVIAKRDYGFKVKRTPTGKAEAAVLFRNMANFLQALIAQNHPDLDALSKLPPDEVFHQIMAHVQ